jgi:hypothetical protein
MFSLLAIDTALLVLDTVLVFDTIKMKNIAANSTAFQSLLAVETMNLYISQASV